MGRKNMRVPNDEKVKEIGAFRLQKGMRINIKGIAYKVIAVRPNGKITLKCKGSMSDEDWADNYATG